VAVLIADTGYELYADCETVRDLDQLYAELGMADETLDEIPCMPLAIPSC
jgi:hypothetical protein